MFDALDEVNWAGFYLSNGKELVLGPFQGKPACIHIPFGKGVCGTAALNDQTLVVEDVHQFPGHIACDSASESEIVIPLHSLGRVIGVMDIDSPVKARFKEEEKQVLEAVAALLENLPVRWEQGFDDPGKPSERFLLREITLEEAQTAAKIESVCFPPNEACSPLRIYERIQAAPELFLAAIDRETGLMAGFLNGIATNEPHLRDEFFTDASLHQKDGENVILCGLDVLPLYRRRGLARAIMEAYCQREWARGRKRIILTCLPDKVKMYRSMGFEDLGISASKWGGEVWHEMMIRGL